MTRCHFALSVTSLMLRRVIKRHRPVCPTVSIHVSLSLVVVGTRWRLLFVSAIGQHDLAEVESTWLSVARWSRST